MIKTLCIGVKAVDVAVDLDLRGVTVSLTQGCVVEGGAAGAEAHPGGATGGRVG